MQTCHHRGAHAIGGMAAFIPSRRDPEVNAVALAKVGRTRARSRRRLRRHLGRAPRPRTGSRRTEFDAVLGERPNQLDRTRDDVDVSEEQLLDFDDPGRSGHRRRPAAQRQRRRPLPRRVAARCRRGGDRQSDGGRGDGRDLARTGLVLGAERGDSTRAGPGGDRTVEATDEAKEVFADVALSTPFKEFLTTSAYGRLP